VIGSDLLITSAHANPAISAAKTGEIRSRPGMVMANALDIDFTSTTRLGDTG